MISRPTYSEAIGPCKICWVVRTRELKGKSFREFTDPVDLPENRRLMEELLQGKSQQFSFEKRLFRKDGTLCWVHNTVSTQRDAEGKPVGLIGSLIDITARKQAEEDLRESEQRFRLMAETIQDVFWIAPRKFRQVDICESGVRAKSGATREEWYASRPILSECHSSRRSERVRANLATILAQPVPWDHEYRIIRPDGEVRWIQDRGFPVRDEQGQVILFTGVATDITERKTLERQLLLAQRMEAVGRLAGGVAHDFNNLLMAITELCRTHA